MRPRAGDRLWPVLATLAAVLAGAIALEVVASDREVDARTVAIETSTGVVVLDDDGDADTNSVEETRAPVDETHARARRAAHRGELDAALELFNKSIAAHPEAGHLHAELGYWLLSVGRTGDAFAALERAAALSPKSPWIALNLGVAASRLGKPAEAEAHFREALALQPGYSAAELALGRALRRRGSVAEAIEILERAAASGGNDRRARALVELGRAYIDGGRGGEAEAKFSRAIELAPAAAEIRIGIARGYQSIGDAGRGRAIQTLRDAVTLAPDVPQVRAALARALERAGDRNAAETEYEHALRLDPGYRYARRRLFRMALDAEDYPRARMHVEYLLRDGPDVPEHHFLAGLGAAREGRADEARRHYHDAIEAAHGDYPEAYLNLGRLERSARRFDEAIAAYRTALELRPDYKQASNNLGLVLEAAGRAGEAEAIYRQVLEAHPDYASAWLNLGGLLMDRRRFDAAIDAFERALAARPGYPAARLDLAIAYRRAGKPEAAIAIYRALVVERPRYVSAWYNLGIALEAADRPSEAIDAFARALAIDGDHLASMRRLARLELRQGDREGADKVLGELLDHAPADADGRVLLADLRKQRGDLDGCAADARIAMTTAPDNPDANRLYRECSSRRSRD